MAGNLVPTPEASIIPTPAKRKREPDSEEDGIEKPSTCAELSPILKDLVVVLSRYDSDLGLLTHPVPSTHFAEPDNKRQKTSGVSRAPRDITSRVESGHYQSLQAFVDDIDQLSDALVAESQGRNDNQSNGIIPADQTNTLVERTKTFKSQLRALLLKLSFRHPDLVTREQDLTNGVSTTASTGPRDDRLALTLIENGPRARQLFSSLQLTNSTLNETTLPKGLLVTKVVPFNPSHSSETKNRTKTIGETFSPRPNLPVLERPQRNRQPTTRPSVVTWLDPLDNAASHCMTGKKHYSSMPLPSGSWLNYGYESPYTSPGIRLSQPSRPQQSQGSTGEEYRNVGKEFNKNDLLFQTLYSSFAPSFDSSGALASRAVKYQHWWEKSAVKRLNTLSLAEQESIAAPKIDPNLDHPGSANILDEDDLENAVQSFEPDTYKDTEPKPQDLKELDGRTDTEVDDILNDISDLVQSLNSYRQLRNLSQDDAAQAQSGVKPTSPGLKSAPSENELAVYEMLRSSLATLIATLPPYAVSKLSGDQLSELNISKKLIIDNVDFAGTLEEDDFTKQQKQAAQVQQNLAARATTSNVPQPRPAGYQQPQAANSYPRHATAARPKQMAPNHHTQGYSLRQPANPVQYQTANPPQPYTPPTQPAQRNYMQQTQFAQPVTASPTYSRSSMLQQFQRSTPNGSTAYPQRRPSPAQPPVNPYQHHPGYQPQLHNNLQQSPLNRSASPQGPHYNQPIPRNPYVNSAAASPVQPRYFQQSPQPANYSKYTTSNQGSPISTPYSKPALPIGYARTAAEQAAIMDRNKLQLMESRGQSQPISTPGQPQSQDMRNPQQNGLPITVSNQPQ
ncbi:hypothetical protein FQN57_000379 [Myotisia sp. PD_48]|nr:hypothetical protein FQN57_000379 [Myotisia sp. PD_48]